MATFGGPLTNQLMCAPARQMTLDQCRALNAKWFSPFPAVPNNQCGLDMLTAAQFLENSVNTVCTPYAEGVPGNCQFYPPIVWVGAGCPRPCATKAIRMGKNPTRYCRSINTYPTYNDGGCKVYYDCNIACKDTCERHRYCQWKSGVCQNKYKLAPRAPLCTDLTPSGTPPCP